MEPTLLPRPRRAAFELGARSRASREDALVVSDPTLPAQGYRVRIAERSVRIDAADEAGEFYARATLEQLGRGEEGMPLGEVEDWPEMTVRGVMLDVSRTKVPTLDTLFSLVDRLASWKVNHLELYLEHTYAYRGHEEVWAGSDPYDAAELRRLAEHCSSRHVELVPNQNCLGHMERWLMHDRYRGLGVARGVVKGPLGIAMPASTLDPSLAGSLELVAGLLEELSVVLPGRYLHVGLDEPWDLPRARAPEWRAWLERLRALPATAQRRLLVWGDMVGAHRELADGLEGVTVCEWGYEAGHPFAARGRALAERGVDHWMCPGTSSWLSLLGRAGNSLANCAEAADGARRSGASGLLVTDWGDFGHLQHLPVSDVGLAAGAAQAWGGPANHSWSGEEVARALDRHCYADGEDVLGEALVALGHANDSIPLAVPNVSALVLHLYFPQLPLTPAMHRDLAPSQFEEASGRIEDAQALLAKACPDARHGRLATGELTASAGVVRLLCEDAAARLAGDGTLASVPARRRGRWADEVDTAIAEHRSRWLARNRPGGLDESCLWLEHLRDSYRSGDPDPEWAGPLVEQLRRGEPQR